MKKINLFVIVFALSFVLSACGTEKAPANSLDEVFDKQASKVPSPASEIDAVTETDSDDAQVKANAKVAEAKLVDVTTWLTMERPREKFSVKHPKTWYYVSNSVEAKKAGFGALIGFGDSSLVWEQNPPYTIEIISIKKDSSKVFDNYNVVAGEDAVNKFIIRSDEQYKEIVDLMVESFQVLK